MSSPIHKNLLFVQEQSALCSNRLAEFSNGGYVRIRFYWHINIGILLARIMLISRIDKIQVDQ